MSRSAGWFDLENLGGRAVSRRAAMKAGVGAAAGVGLAATGLGASTSPANAGISRVTTAPASFVARLSNVRETGRFAAPYTDLLIPVRRADGSLLLVGGDTYDSRGPGDGNDWRSPIALTSGQTAENGRILIDGAIVDRPNHAKPLVPQNRNGTQFTWLPTDVFRVGSTLYMNVVIGPLGSPQGSQFYRSRNNGQDWELLRFWSGGLYGGQFQQKTYAADTNDAYVYVMSTVFQRDTRSGLLLFRILKTDLDKTQAQADASGFGERFAYQGWGFANGRWAWGNQPTTILETRHWGEICFRAMGGKYALSWFQRNPGRVDLEDIRAMVFPLPTSNLVQTTEQTLVYQDVRNPSTGGSRAQVQPALYGPFIVPGSTFDRFDFMVSNWIVGEDASETNYGVSQWRGRLNPNLSPG